MTKTASAQPIRASPSTASPHPTISSVELPSRVHDDIYTIHTRCLFDSITSTFHENISLSISRTTGLISGLEERASLSPSSYTGRTKASDLDWTHFPLVLPGLADLHTHIFLHPYSAASSIAQETQESPVERILRATNHLRSALKAGFTTYRDLGTEGVFTADIDVRNAVNRGIVPGPRLFVAGEAIASSGGYAVRSENDASASLGSPYAGTGFALATTTLGRISDQADGLDGVRAAVRRRMASGADLIKVYADYRSRALRWPAADLISRPNDANREIRFPPTNFFARNPIIPLWTQDELSVLVLQARAMGSTVAAHAVSARAAFMALSAGVTTIEHAFEDEADEAAWNPFSSPLATDSVLTLMARRQAIWHPTLYILEDELPPALFTKVCDRVNRAYKLGVRIGVGGDTGAMAHGGNAREMELLVTKCCIPIEVVLRAATLGGWEGIWGREVVSGDKTAPQESEEPLPSHHSPQGNQSKTELNLTRQSPAKAPAESTAEPIAKQEVTSILHIPAQLGRVLGVADTQIGKDNTWTGTATRRFGALREGWVADLVALGGDVRDDLAALRDVRVVVKDGAVVVSDRRIVE